MATGVVRIEQLPFDETHGGTRRASHGSHEDRSSSGVSSASHSPVSTSSDGTGAHVNAGMDLDPEDLMEARRPSCPGVLCVSDDVGSDVVRPLKKATAVESSIASRCRDLVQCKFRSLPVPVLPMKEAVDQKPLSGDRASTVTLPPTPPAGRCRCGGDASATPRPPFSCVPIYVFILAATFIVLLIAGATTLVRVRPELFYLTVPNNSSSFANNETLSS